MYDKIKFYWYWFSDIQIIISEFDYDNEKKIDISENIILNLFLELNCLFNNKKIDIYFSEADLINEKKYLFKYELQNKSIEEKSIINYWKKYKLLSFEWNICNSNIIRYIYDVICIVQTPCKIEI